MNYENEIEEEVSITPQDEDYVMFDSGTLGSKVSVSKVRGRFLGEFHTRQDAENFLLKRMKEESFFPNVFFQDDHGGIDLVTISYNLWEDKTLTIGEKYREAYKILMEKGYVLSINESLPSIQVDKYIPYDGKIHKETIYHSQGHEAEEMLNEVPEDIYFKDYIMVKIAG